MFKQGSNDKVRNKARCLYVKKKEAKWLNKMRQKATCLDVKKKKEG